MKRSQQFLLAASFICIILVVVYKNQNSKSSAGFHSSHQESDVMTPQILKAKNLTASEAKEIHAHDSHAEHAPAFNYKVEAEQIAELGKQLPGSKSKLLKIITAPDFYAAQNKAVDPHTIHEIHQRQKGAVKVLALKTLMSEQKSKEQILADLEIIINTAQDETIKNIATAAKDSVSKNRPFFKDTLDALSNL